MVEPGVGGAHYWLVVVDANTAGAVWAVATAEAGCDAVPALDCVVSSGGIETSYAPPLAHCGALIIYVYVLARFGLEASPPSVCCLFIHIHIVL